jgi:ANTAR domain-containing protein
VSAHASEAEPLTLLRLRVEALEADNENLRIALASRIVIEQAKGVLIERLDLPPEAVFELLRSAARRSRRKVHEIASEILQTRANPEYIEREIRHLLHKNGRAWPFLET